MSAPLTRTLSVLSAGTVVPNVGFVCLSVPELCELIQQRQSLQQAVIKMTEGYKGHIAGVVHRFLVLELEREGRKWMWLRLDRRLGKNVSGMSLILASGVTSANDTVSSARH